MTKEIVLVPRINGGMSFGRIVGNYTANLVRVDLINADAVAVIIPERSIKKIPEGIKVTA